MQIHMSDGGRRLPGDAFKLAHALHGSSPVERSLCHIDLSGIGKFRTWLPRAARVISYGRPAIQSSCGVDMPHTLVPAPTPRRRGFFCLLAALCRSWAKQPGHGKCQGAKCPGEHNNGPRDSVPEGFHPIFTGRCPRRCAFKINAYMKGGRKKVTGASRRPQATTKSTLRQSRKRTF